MVGDQFDVLRCGCGMRCHRNARCLAAELQRVGTENIRLKEFLRQWLDLHGSTTSQLSAETRALLTPPPSPPTATERR